MRVMKAHNLIVAGSPTVLVRAYYYIAKLFKWQIIYSYIEMNFHSLYIFLLPGYGLKWLCGWNFNIFYWIAATFGVVFIIILCHIPRKVIFLCLQLLINLISYNGILKIYNLFFLYTARWSKIQTSYSSD